MDGEEMATELTARKIMKICKPFDESTYRNMGLNPIAAYAVHVLETNQMPTTLENVTVALFIMFPKKFSLPGFDDYPDSARVTRVLLHLTPKYVNWLVGNPTRGYALNEAGRQAAIEAAKDLDNPVLGEPAKHILRQPRSKYEREMNRLRGTSAFQKFLARRSTDINKWEVFDLLSAAPYTPAAQLRGRATELLQLAQDFLDTEVTDFLQMILKQFSEIFVGKFSEEKQTRRKGKAIE